MPSILLCGRLAVVASVGMVVWSAGVRAGPIDPPAGPVEPTMKTLTQVEPRTAINSTNTPGDEDAAFIIDQPGSYYLTQNFIIIGRINFPDPGLAPRDGIRIEADNVTIDLNGFTLAGGSGASAGIVTKLGTEFTNITIRNGVVSGFESTGIRLQEDLGGTGEAIGAGLVEDVQSTNNGGHGISGGGLTVVRCQANDNGGNGINANIVTDSNAERNAGTGIIGTIVRNCVASENDDGITVSSGRVEGCSAFRNAADGIAASGGVVSDCSAWNNTGDGFSVTNSVVRDSVARSNDDAGFRLLENSTIDRCMSSGNGTGYRAQQSGNRLSGNTATENTTNWSIAGGNICRVIAITSGASINGDSGGFDINQGPWDNFTH